MSQRKKIILIVASWFYLGYAPVASGTFGTLGALPLAWLISGRSIATSVTLVFAFILLAITIANEAESILGSKDPGVIVIDEVAGLLVTFLGIPWSITHALAGFMLFRLFDILKPFPIRIIEDRIKGGGGVVLDDVTAGIYANAALRLLMFCMGK
ncbi:MAG: phosphatidylglycerophosphatase A [Pseudomonadota bacterium]